MILNRVLSKVEYPELTPVWIAVFVDILGFSVLIPLLPYFSAEYGAPPWVIGLLLSTNALFGFFSGPIWGALSDKHGRKRMLLISQAGTLVGFLMLAFSTNLTMLFASRIVDGIFGGNYPIAKAIIGDVAPRRDRGRLMTNVGTAHVLASLVGPGLGGFLSNWGIVAPGLASAALSLLTIVLTLLFVRETHPNFRTSRDGADSLDTTGGSDSEDAEVPAALPSRGAVLRNPVARFFLAQWGLHTFSFFIYISSISLFAYLRLGLTPQQVGRVLMISGAVRVFIRFVVFVPLLRRLGDRRTSQLGLATFVVTFLALGFIQNQFQFGAVLCGVSFAAGCARGILNSFISLSVSPLEQGRAMGLSSSLDSLAQIAGPIIGSVVLGYLPLYVYGGIASLFALGAFLMSFNRYDLHREPASGQ
jgi:MFS family permease